MAVRRIAWCADVGIVAAGKVQSPKRASSGGIGQRSCRSIGRTVESMPLSIATCPACGSSTTRLDHRAARILGLADPFGVVQCAGCGLRRLDPMPTDEEFRQLYELNYFAGTDNGTAPSWLRDYPAVPYEEALTQARLDAYRARLRRLAGLFPARGTLLDVGMATGEFAAMASADGWRVCGVDVSAEACRRAAERGIEAHCGDLHATGLEGRCFDVVHLHHVFEHFTQPRDALARLLSFLGPSSLLIIEVPSQFDSWTRRLVNWVRLATGRGMARSVLSIHHPYFYSCETITALLGAHQSVELVWRQTYFPERWAGPAYRKVLRLIDFVADLAGHHGENVEIAVRIRPGPAT